MTRHRRTPRPARRRYLPRTELAALRRLAPEEWRARIRAGLVAVGTVKGAAKALGLHARTLQRWLRLVPECAEGIALAGPGDPSRGGNLRGKGDNSRQSGDEDCHHRQVRETA